MALVSGSDISVVLPVHLGAHPEHLRAALSSLYTQTTPPGEVIVVEDGPLTPEHLEVLREFESAKPPLRRERLPINRGVAIATQAGVMAAKLPWIARMDADDVAMPHRFEVQIAALQRGHIDVVGAAMVEFHGELANTVGTRRMPIRHDEIVTQMRTNNPFNHPTVIYRRSLALKVGGYRELAHLEDYDLFARMWAAGARLHNVDEPVLFFRADDMLRRRRQRGIHRAELQLQRNLRSYGLTTGGRMAWNLTTRTLFRLLPEFASRRLYRLIFHT